MKIRIIIPTLFHKEPSIYEDRLNTLKKQLSDYDYDIIDTMLSKNIISNEEYNILV